MTKRLVISLCALIVLLASHGVQAAAPPAGQGTLVPPGVMTERAVKCERMIEERRTILQPILNVSFGALLGGGLGALAGGFFNATWIGVGIGGVYGAVVGYFGGNDATKVIEERMLAACIAGTL